MSVKPWTRLGPVAGPQRAARWGLVFALTGSATALWGLLGAPGWLVERRPHLVLEAYLAESATPVQVDEFSRSVQGQPWCCGMTFLGADEARAEAGRDARVKSLLEAYGGNPFLRSFRLTMCPEALDRHEAAAGWLKDQPGIASVRAPRLEAIRSLEGERRILGITRLAFGALLGFSVLGLWFALGALGAAAAPELRVYAELGATPGRILARALTAVGGPAVLLAVVVTVAMEFGSVLARFSAGYAPGTPASVLPPFPHAAGPLVCGGAALASLATALWLTRRRGLLRPR